MMMKNKNLWHIVYVKFRHEISVCNKLERLGVESFLPIISTTRNWSDRKKLVNVPLFPNYVFVNIKSSIDFHKIESVDSVSSFVRFGKDYGKISQEEIEFIKLLIENKDIVDIKSNSQLPHVGDEVKISYGELSGFKCQVYRVGNNKINVWINSLQQNISATIPADYLQEKTIISCI